MMAHLLSRHSHGILLSSHLFSIDIPPDIMFTHLLQSFGYCLQSLSLVQKVFISGCISACVTAGISSSAVLFSIL